MKCLSPPSVVSKIALTVAVYVCMAASHAQAAWHDAYHGQDLTVHYVHLKGFDGDNTVNRNLLLTEHKACVTRNKALGKPSASLTPADLPAIPQSEDVEIYYGDNRTLTVKKGKFYHIAFDTCALEALPHHVWKLHSDIGRCDIDLLKKEARGQCDANAHRHVLAQSFPRRSHAKIPEIDINKVPPNMRAQVLAQIKQMKMAQETAPPVGSSATGATKIVAGYPCAIYRLDSIDSEKCIANPKSDFAIPVSPLNAENPGLLLEAKLRAMTLGAQDVKLHIWVSENLFSVPQGTKILPQAGGQ